MTQAAQPHQHQAIGAFTAAVAEELRAQMARKRVSGRELARRVHVSAQWMSQRTRGIVAINTDEMEMLAAALGITIADLLADAAQRTNTDVDTRRFSPPASDPRPALSLVTPLPPGNRPVTPGNGSTTPEPGDGDRPDGLFCVQGVNYADAS